MKKQFKSQLEKHQFLSRGNDRLEAELASARADLASAGSACADSDAKVESLEGCSCL